METTAQSVVTATDTLMTWDETVIDRGSIYLSIDAANNEIDVNLACELLIIINMRITALADGKYFTAIAKETTTTINATELFVGAAGNNRLIFTGRFTAAAGAKIRAHAYHSHGANRDVNLDEFTVIKL